MKEYEFKVSFYETYGTFTASAENVDVAIDTAYQIISNALKDLPVEVDYDIECITDEDEEEDEDGTLY